MNYIRLFNQFLICRKEYNFSSDLQSVYLELFQTANSSHWRNPISIKDDLLCATCNIGSRHTLQTYRNKLKQAGLIDFKTKQGVPTKYYFILAEDSAKEEIANFKAMIERRENIEDVFKKYVTIVNFISGLHKDLHKVLHKDLHKVFSETAHFLYSKKLKTVKTQNKNVLLSAEADGEDTNLKVGGKINAKPRKRNPVFDGVNDLFFAGLEKPPANTAKLIGKIATQLKGVGVQTYEDVQKLKDYCDYMAKNEWKKDYTVHAIPNHWHNSKKWQPKQNKPIHKSWQDLQKN